MTTATDAHARCQEFGGIARGYCGAPAETRDKIGRSFCPTHARDRKLTS